MAEVLLKNYEGSDTVYMQKAKNTGDVDLDYLLECKEISKTKYEKMKNKDIYEVQFRYADDFYPSAGSWWFESKVERNKFWDSEIKKNAEEVA
jgi:hypothetical protein